MQNLSSFQPAAINAHKGDMGRSPAVSYPDRDLIRKAALQGDNFLVSDYCPFIKRLSPAVQDGKRFHPLAPGNILHQNDPENFHRRLPAHRYPILLPRNLCVFRQIMAVGFPQVRPQLPQARRVGLVNQSLRRRRDIQQERRIPAHRGFINTDQLL